MRCRSAVWLRRPQPAKASRASRRCDRSLPPTPRCQRHATPDPSYKPLRLKSVRRAASFRTHGFGPTCAKGTGYCRHPAQERLLHPCEKGVRRVFPQLPGTDHFRYTHDPFRNRFSRDCPGIALSWPTDLAWGQLFLARLDLPKTTGGTARFTTSRRAKLDWIRATRGRRESSVL